jgi:prepilin-type N-terminal cleavage/methylation domain-containing protein
MKQKPSLQGSNQEAKDAAQGFTYDCPLNEAVAPMQGFGLIEMMVALVVLVFGLLSAGQMLFIAAASDSLARSSGTAAIVAQDRLEFLGDLYQRDPLASDLAVGHHGPIQTEIMNPADAGTLNLYRIEWDVAPVADPRPGKLLEAKLVTVTIAPSRSDGTLNNKAGLNKTLNVGTILSRRTR